jgi:glutamine amidotransferase
VAEIARELREIGPANFLYADGETLFAHSDRRPQPGGAIAPPGLHLLERACAREPSLGPGISLEAGEQQVVLLASVPLSAEAWTPLGRGALVAIEGGSVVASIAEA